MNKKIVSEKERFENHLGLKVSPSSVKRYMGYYNAWQPIGEVAKINQDIVNEFLIACKNTQTVRAFMRNYLDFIKNKNILIPKLTETKPRKIPNVMNEKQVSKIRKYLYTHGEHKLRNGIMFSLTYQCALRRNELLTILPESFEWDDWLDNKKSGCKLKVYGKGRKDRHVIVSPRLMNNIELYSKRRLRRMEEGQTFFGISRSNWDNIVRGACDKAVGKHFKVHEIRISRATNWHEEGLDIVNVKNRLGHANISTTQLYINPSAKKELDDWMREVS